MIPPSPYDPNDPTFQSDLHVHVAVRRGELLMSQFFNGEGSGMVVYLRHDWMLSREFTRDLDLGCRIVANLAVNINLDIGRFTEVGTR